MQQNEDEGGEDEYLDESERHEFPPYGLRMGKAQERRVAGVHCGVMCRTRIAIALGASGVYLVVALLDGSFVVTLGIAYLMAVSTFHLLTVVRRPRR